jgi:hypothetical protein
MRELQRQIVMKMRARNTQEPSRRSDGPTVLVGQSFSGIIVTEAGMHPKVSALVYVAARAPDAGEDYTALAKTFPTLPASAGIVFDGDEGRLSEAAFLRDFAGDLPEAKARVLYAVQEPFHKALLTGKTTHAAWRSKPSFYAVSTEDRDIDVARVVKGRWCHRGTHVLFKLKLWARRIARCIAKILDRATAEILRN